jgi:hypothetical protein
MLGCGKRATKSGGAGRSVALANGRNFVTDYEDVGHVFA